MKKLHLVLVAIVLGMIPAVQAQTVQEVTAEEISRAVSDTLYWDALNAFGIDKNDDIAGAIRKFKESGEADIIEKDVQKGKVVMYPFGESQPVLTCSIRRACLVRLEKGEIPYELVFGDDQRWGKVLLNTGPMRDTPMFAVKPYEPKISTNIIITTNRRIYHIFAVSTKVKKSKRGETLSYPNEDYDREIGFYYPNMVVHLWNQAISEKQEEYEVAHRVRQEQKAEEKAKEKKKDRSYDVVYDEGFPVEIKEIFSSEGRTYIELSDDGEYDVSPAIFANDIHGEREIVNYHIDGRYYVVDRVAKTLELVIGQGMKRTWYGKKKPIEVRAQIINRG